MERTELDARAPEALETLVTLFSAVEFGLNSLALYQRTADFEAVKLAVESSCQSQFNLEHLQQILWLVPNAYTLSWTRKSKTSRGRGAGASTTGTSQHDTEDEPVLLIRRRRLTEVVAEAENENETLTDRIYAFIRRVNEFISEHVDAIEAMQPGLDEDELQKQLVKLTVVPKAELPPKMDATLAKQQQQRLDELKKTGGAAAHVTEEELSDALAAPIPQDLQSLPKWLVDKVRRQEQQSKKATKRSDDAQRQRVYTTLPQLGDQIQSYALVKRKHVFAMTELSQGLTRAPLRGQLVEQVHLLETMVPFWITVFYSDGKEFVRLSKTHKYNAVKTALRKAIATEL
ncbi:hypothetical protein Poli38472_011087 [Pythium oligandrum]|uniref:CDT1 Geminin-binding domain-containing protein n=1 Tax=Pythium oligandrum TaxID=41045 RepID=A0A8K1CRN6_PYTOL|nr:hypothetical protein Poli38472_011087 [Pythium oligandrum]|eukprot:TMW67467.1 hypothetical protein Poli38472_011087 [Pythium oligandrum]